MRNYIITIFLALICSLSFSQQTTRNFIDTSNISIEEVVITATRTKRAIKDIPAQVDIIKSSKIESHAVNNIDDILKSTANVFVNRSWGIFSKNSSVTMRGLEGSSRTLVLIDGVPKNKIAGGSVNWHNVNPDLVERIEVIKGPSSALYGNNAMGGVINIITKRPQQGISGSIKSFAGTYKTLGTSINLSGNEVKNNEGFYWNFNSFYRQGDGYIFEPAEYLDDTDTETFLKEYGTGVLLGYEINKNQKIELIYDYYDELRGAGRQVYTDDGSYDKYITNQLKARYNLDINNTKIVSLVYYNYEDYNAQKESVNDYYEYKLSHANSYKTDKGAWIGISKELLPNNYFTFGADFRQGNLYGNEIYRTSPDVIKYEGIMQNKAWFVQDEINLLNNKLKIIAGLRQDFISFSDGWQKVEEPSKNTGFSEGFEEEFESVNHTRINPKLAIQYSLSTKSKIYASFSTGINPPKLDDLCKTGKIRKGFRLANPLLQPEILYNYEIGYNTFINSKFSISSAVYYSYGKDFHYLLATGDSIDTGGSSLKPVLYRDNISEIEIIGTEISLKYSINSSFDFETSYAYNHSVISDFNIDESNATIDLTGLYLVEVSPHVFYASISHKNRFFAATADCIYADSQWADSENTLLLEDYFLVNIKLSKSVWKFNFYVEAQNIFDVEYIDRKGRLSPGRFVIAGLKYTFSN